MTSEWAHLWRGEPHEVVCCEVGGVHALVEVAVVEDGQRPRGAAARRRPDGDVVAELHDDFGNALDEVADDNGTFRTSGDRRTFAVENNGDRLVDVNEKLASALTADGCESTICFVCRNGWRLVAEKLENLFCFFLRKIFCVFKVFDFLWLFDDYWLRVDEILKNM